MDIYSEVSYVTLSTVCLGCIAVNNKQDYLFLLTAGVVLLYAVLGALKTAGVGDSNLKGYIEKGHEYLTLLVPLTALSALDADIWVRHHLFGSKNYGLAHALAGIAMSAAFTLQSVEQQYMDTVVGVEGMSLLGAAIYKKNYFAACAGILFLAAYYLVYHYEGSWTLPISKDDLYQYLLAGFVFCAMKSVNTWKCPLR